LKAFTSDDNEIYFTDIIMAKKEKEREKKRERRRKDLHRIKHN